MRLVSSFLESDFFNRESHLVAEDLIGCSLVRQSGDSLIKLTIKELEIYDGFDDKASHARFGRTERNAPMFGPPGYWYMYFIYGMYFMINITTREEGYPAALLLRAAGEFEGPGKLSKALDVGKDLSGVKAHPDCGFWFERGQAGPKRILKQPRIGIDYAHDWRDKKLRYTLKSSADSSLQ